MVGAVFEVQVFIALATCQRLTKNKYPVNWDKEFICYDKV